MTCFTQLGTNFAKDKMSRATSRPEIVSPRRSFPATYSRVSEMKANTGLNRGCINYAEYRGRIFS
jgi:hypothetical protein